MTDNDNTATPLSSSDAAHELAVAGGAQSLQPPTDQPHGARSATIMDPFGHRWMFSQPLHALTTKEINANYDNFEVVANADDGS